MIKLQQRANHTCRSLATSLKALLCVTLTMAIFGSTWGETYTDENERTWTFTTNSTSATVTGIDPLRGVIKIPETLAGKPVRAFGTVFKEGANVTFVVIPSGVTAIDSQSFFGCKNLQGVTINATNMTSIGYQAFKDCYNMESFIIPNSVKTLGQGVFSGCTSLEEVTIGDGIETLTGVEYGSPYDGKYSDSVANTDLYGSYDNGLFYSCTSLKTINWGKNVKTIGNIAFLRCSALEEVTIPDTVTMIGNHAFYWCDNLTTVTIGDSVTTIGRMAFRADADLAQVAFGKSVTEIQQQAFHGCANLNNFTLPTSTRYLRYRCFADCNKAMTSVTIPTNADGNETKLAQGVFSGCSKVATVTLGDTVTTLTGVEYGSPYDGKYSDSVANTDLYGSYDNGLFYNCTSLKTINWGKNVKTIGNIAFLRCSALEEVTIPDTVTMIGNHAFYWCDNLTTVKIGAKVTMVGRMAFRADGNLTNVTFGKAVEEIQQQAFQDCANLKNFTLPNSLLYLRYRCFAGCSGAMTSVTIPTNEYGVNIELGQGVFSGCSKLATVTLGDTVKTLTGVEYGSPYDGKYSDSVANTDFYGSYDNGLFYNCTSLKTINWGKKVKTIGNIAFLRCTALENVMVPDTVETIGNHAFYWCGNLKTVTIGANVTTIGRMAFRADANLTKVTFGSSVKDIQQQAFQDCVSLQNFTLSESLQSLAYRCFAGCKALTEMTIPASKYGQDTVLGQGVFSGCSKLATVTFGDTVKTLTGVEYGSPYDGKYSDSSGYTDLYGSYGNGLFYNCTSLKTINWGNGVETIGNIAFLNCSALGSVTLPANIKSIGCHAFYGCKSLKTVDVANSITRLGRRAFANCPYLHYVDFQGATMSYEAGSAEAFAFDKEYLTVYAAVGSTGWKGQTEVGGLPESGMWSGARIVYEPVDPMMDNPYDFYPLSPTVNKKTWKAPVIVTASPYLSGKTDPTVLTGEIQQDDPVYLSFCWDEYWRGMSADGLTNRFTLASSGKSLATWDFGTRFDKTWGTNGGWCTNDVVAALQNLPIGEYALTMAINPAKNLAETDYSNNSTSIAFKIVKRLPVKVTFNRNGGTGGTASLAAVEYLEPMPTITVPTKAGLVFCGYWTTASGEGVQYYKANGTSARTSDLKVATTLYARWDTPAVYTVRFHKNDGTTTTSDQSFSCGVAQSLAWKDSQLKWTRTGYTFIGWALDAGSGLVKYANGEKVKDVAAKGEVKHLYAVWANSNAYTVVYHNNTPTGDTVQVRHLFWRGTGKSLAWKDSQLAWANPSGYTFLGWATSASGAVVYSNGQKVNNIALGGKTIHLYAKWKANAYTVRYHYNYGTDTRTADQAFTYGKEQALKWLDSGLKWPHPQSASFLGWAETANGAKKYANGQSVKNLTTANNGVVHLYAKWNLITVRFHKNVGGTDVTALQYFKPGVAQCLTWKDSGLKWTTPSGKLFVGWGLKANAPVANYANGASVKNPTSAGNTLDLYAIWAAADSYIVKLYRNHSSTDATVAYQGILRTGASLAWKDSVLGWANPSGKTFLGWSKTRTATTATYKNGATVTGLAAKGSTIALYAIWSTPKKSAAARGEVTFSSLQNKVLPAAPQSAVLTWAPGYYRGLFADDAGTFDLLLGEFDEDGVADAYFSAQTADGLWTEACEAMVVGETLALTLEDRVVILSYQEGELVATE